MEQGIAAGLERVKVSESTSPDKIQQAIKLVIDDLRHQFATLPEGDAGDAIWAFASIWGETITRGSDWEWTIILDDDEEIHAITSPSRSHIIYPFHYMHSLLSDPDLIHTSSFPTEAAVDKAG